MSWSFPTSEKRQNSKLSLSLGSICAILLTVCFPSFIIGRRYFLQRYPHNQPVTALPNFKIKEILTKHVYPRFEAIAKKKGQQHVWRELSDLIIRNEMVIHPALITNLDPKQVAIVASSNSVAPLVKEIRKHSSVGAIWIKDSSACDASSESSHMDWVLVESLLESKRFSRLSDVVFLLDSHALAERSQEKLEFWFRHMSPDGMLVMPLPNNPGERFNKIIIELEQAGFARITDYDIVLDHDARTPSKYAVAFKSFSAKGMWHMNEALYNLEIMSRSQQNEDTHFPFKYFDSAAMMSIQYPSRLSEREHCQFYPFESTNSSRPEVCTEGHGLNPERHDVPTNLLKVQTSSEGENAGRGIFASVDIPLGSYIDLETSSHPVRCPWYCADIVIDFYEAENEILNAYGLYYYMDGYGFMDEKTGFVEYTVDSGILTFCNHGCNGTFNLGVTSPFHEFNVNLTETIPAEYLSPSIGVTFGVYIPGLDRTQHYLDWICINFKAIQAENELLDNYLPFAGEGEFKTNVVGLRKLCSGAMGLVEQRQQNTTRAKLGGNADHSMG